MGISWIIRAASAQYSGVAARPTKHAASCAAGRARGPDQSGLPVRSTKTDTELWAPGGSRFGAAQFGRGDMQVALTAPSALRVSSE